MTVARTREVLEPLLSYRPGRTADDLAREGRAAGGTPPVKLASNELAFPPLRSVLAAIGEAAKAANRYPDFAATRLVERLAEHHGFDPAGVVLGAGSVALCRHVVEACAGVGDEVLSATPSFDVPLTAARILGATAVTRPLKAGSFDLDALADAVTPRTRVVYLCSPNNPTGTVVGHEATERLLEAIPHDVLVVIDEAYREFVTDPEAVDGFVLARQHPNVAVLRTFSKAYGLAGLRVGVCFTADPLADVIRKVTIPFGVSSLAQAAAEASLSEPAQDELEERVATVLAERSRVVAVLRCFGYELPDPQGNFVWLPLDAPGEFAAGCEARGVIVRPIGDLGVRVTIGLPAENNAFLSAAAELRQ